MECVESTTIITYPNSLYIFVTFSIDRKESYEIFQNHTTKVREFVTFVPSCIGKHFSFLAKKNNTM